LLLLIPVVVPLVVVVVVGAVRIVIR